MISYTKPCLLLCVLYCLCTPQLLAQQRTGTALTDSLFDDLSKVKTDTAKIWTYHRLARNYVFTEPEKAMGYINRYMALSKKINWSKGIGLALMNTARVNNKKDDYSAAIDYARKAYDAFKVSGQKVPMADAMSMIGYNYECLGYYDKSIEYSYAALRLYEAASDTAGLGRIYNSLGINYYRINDFQKAIEYYKKGLVAYRIAGDQFGIASALDNIASIYMEQGDFTKANDYNLQGIQIFEAIHDQSAMARIYCNRGNLMQYQKDFKAAIDWYNKSIKINNQLDIKRGLAFNNGGIGELYLKYARDKDSGYIVPSSFAISRAALLEKSHYYFTEALKQSTAIDELSLMARFTSSLSETENHRGNYKAALDYFKTSTQYKDSIFNDENKRKIAALEKEQLTATKDKEIQLLNKDKALQASEIKRQTATKNGILAAVALATVLAAYFIWSYNRRKKAGFEKEVVEMQMKALRAQMNPHFIFNSLHSINKYMMENDKGNASNYLSKFSKLMRLILENSREQYVSLEHDLAALELYMQLEALRFKNGFQYKIETDAALDIENTVIPPMILQPFVENAILHGIAQKEDGFIYIYIKRLDDKIWCIVEDNGTGSNMTVLPGKEQVKKHQSLGIKIIQERLDLINRLQKVKTGFAVSNIKDAENAPSGLRVELFLPFQLSF